MSGYYYYYEAIKLLAATTTYLVGGLTSWIRQRVPTIEDTVQNLETIKGLVSSRENELRSKTQEHLSNAEIYAKDGKMHDARVQIRLKMLYENQLRHTQRTLTAISSHLVSLQSAELNRSVYLALNDSSRALGYRGHTEDSVDQVLERLDDAHAQTEEIMQLITTSPNDHVFDESDIDAELERLVPAKHHTETQHIEKTTAIQLPICPSDPPIFPQHGGDATAIES